MKILVRDFDVDPWEVSEFDKFGDSKLFPVIARNVGRCQAMLYDEAYHGTTKNIKDHKKALQDIYRASDKKSKPSERW